jgi:glycine cleavage system transcriptional repressor
MAKEYLVVTIIGPDKRGTVAKITDVIVDYSANIEESRMARLGGDFAVIMLISLNNGDREGLLVGLNELLDGQEAKLFVKETDLARTRIFE